MTESNRSRPKFHDSENPAVSQTCSCRLEATPAAPKLLCRIAKSGRNRFGFANPNRARGERGQAAPAGLPNPAETGFGFANPNRAMGPSSGRTCE